MNNIYGEDRIMKLLAKIDEVKWLNKKEYMIRRSTNYKKH
jgi:hypothetical protein